MKLLLSCVALALSVTPAMAAPYRTPVHATFKSRGEDRKAIAALLDKYTKAVSTRDQALFESLLLDKGIPFSGVPLSTKGKDAIVQTSHAIDRFAMETKRQYDVLDRRLAETPYLAGDDYSIADIAVWSWYGNVALGRFYGDAAEFLSLDEYTNVQRWLKAIADRPAVKRGRMVNSLFGDPSEQLHERHDASDFDRIT